MVDWRQSVRRLVGSALTILIPTTSVDSTLEECLRAISSSAPVEGITSIGVLVVVDGGRDHESLSIDIEVKSLLSAAGFILEVSQSPHRGKPATLRYGEAKAPDGHVLMLDVRMRVSERTIGMLWNALQESHLRLVSGDIRYGASGSQVALRFARAYSASPYARSLDLKGACVLFSPAERSILAGIPEVVADDRYFLSRVKRSERTKVSGAVVHYEFRSGAFALIRQQARWTSANRSFDNTNNSYDRNEHETRSRPYFGPGAASFLDKATYVAIIALGRILGRVKPATPSW